MLSLFSFSVHCTDNRVYSGEAILLPQPKELANQTLYWTEILNNVNFHQPDAEYRSQNNVKEGEKTFCDCALLNTCVGFDCQ